MVCSPGTTFDRSFSDSIGGIGPKSKLRSESHNDFFRGFEGSLTTHKNKNSQSLEEPMTPSVVISFEAETSKRYSGGKSRPQSLVSLSDYPCVTPASSSGHRHTATLQGRLNWSQQSRDSCCSTTSLQRAFETGGHSKGGLGVGGGLHLPSARYQCSKSCSILYKQNCLICRSKTHLSKEDLVGSENCLDIREDQMLHIKILKN